MIGRLVGKIRAALTTSKELEQVLIAGGSETNAGVPVTPEKALRAAAVAAAVGIIAESVAQLPLHFYRRLDRGKERVRDNPIAALLSGRPNVFQNGFEFIETLTSHMVLWGNAYAVKITSGRRIIELLPIHPNRVDVSQDNRYRLNYSISLQNGEYLELPSDRVLHLRDRSLDGITGMSRVMLGKDSVGLALQTERHGARLFANGVRPSGILTTDTALSKEAVDKLRAAFTAASGGDGAYGVPVLDNGIKFASMSMESDKAQFLETRKFQIAEVARMFRVPPHMLGDLERATFCLPAGTEVLTDKGPQAIETIEPGATVWSRHDAQWVKSRVSASVCSGEDPILTIKTTNRTLRANAKHRILARRKVAAPASGRGGYQSVKWVTEYVPAGELRVGDTVVCADRLPLGGSRQTPTRQASSGFMEFCGLILGDGNVYPKWGVSIARASHATYMDHYRDVITSDFKRYDGGNGRGDSTAVALAPVTLIEQERQTKFASVTAARELEQLGLCGTARTKTVPAWVFEMDEDLRLSFLRGFLDADGHVDKLGRICYSSCNRTMLSQIRHLCIGCGIPVTNLRLQKGRTTLPNGKQTDFAQWSFVCSDPGSNRRIGTNDSRYVERLRDGAPFDRKSRNYPHYGGKDFIDSGCTLARITSIDVGEIEPVYDLTVEGTHNFVADGVVVHNSNIEQQSLEFVQYTLMPWLRRWEYAINTQLLGPGDVFAEFLVDGLLRGDFNSRVQGYSKALMDGWLSVNEVRELENRSPIDGGDEYRQAESVFGPSGESDGPDPTA